MQSSSAFRQTIIYFRKIVRIAFHEKFWKFIIFSTIISFLVSMVVGEKMFTTYESTKSGFFSFACASIWIGIFNSIQTICKEHEIIRADYRSGMKISSFVTANVVWQLAICLVQSAIMVFVSLVFVNYHGNGIIFENSMIEYFTTIFLITFGSDIMGLMISSISGNPTTAMTIMPFVLIIQLIMSGVLFEIDGWAEKVAYFTFSKWGMSAFGSIADLNNESYPLKLSQVFPQVIRLEAEACYEHTAVNLLTGWLWCVGICFVCYLICIISLKIRNHGS